MEHKAKPTIDSIREEYTKYINHSFKYPKSQFCYFYFKGICQLPNCQFAHGVPDFNFENFLALIKDKPVFQSEKQSQWQKPYFYRLIPIEQRTFDSLFNYQNTHLDSFSHSHIYTQQELILDSLKRMDIRREINKDIFIAFAIKLLEHFGQLDKVKFFQYFIDAGYCYSFQAYTKLSIYYSKKIKDKVTKKTQEIVRLYPSNEEMMKSFAKALEDYAASYKEKGNGNAKSMFPMSFTTINSIISKHIDILAPTPYHFIERNSVSQKLFCEELVKYILKSDKLKEVIMDKKDLSLSDFYVVINLNEIIEEIKGTFWNKHYTTHNTQFGYVSFDFIEKTFDINNNKEFNSELIRSNVLYELFKAKNLICIDNTSGLYVFNYTKFLSYDINDLIESYYHKRCNMIDKEIAEESMKMFQLNTDTVTNNDDECEGIIDAKLSFNTNVIIERKGDGDIIVVDNANTLHYFISQIMHSEILSIDLEGQLSLGKINLIQICDKDNEIFIIDVHTFMTSKDKTLIDSIPLLKKFLFFIFESHSIKKIFFDGRNDVNALHRQFNICPNNYIDLSSLQSVINCFIAQIEFAAMSNGDSNSKSISIDLKKEFDIFVKNFNAFNRKGLNAVLSKYNTGNKTNELKDTMHKLMDEQPIEYFLSRPINNDFLIYSALDVKYLKTTYINMKTDLITQLKNIYGNSIAIDDNKIDLIILILSIEHLNYGCKKANDNTQ